MPYIDEQIMNIDYTICSNIDLLEFPETSCQGLFIKKISNSIICCRGCRKTSFSEQPLARNHAFERISKKNRVLRTHFFFPCINSEIHAPGIYEFAKQIRLNACCRTKHKNRILLFRQAEATVLSVALCLLCMSFGCIINNINFTDEIGGHCKWMILFYF